MADDDQANSPPCPPVPPTSEVGSARHVPAGNNDDMWRNLLEQQNRNFLAIIEAMKVPHSNSIQLPEFEPHRHCNPRAWLNTADLCMAEKPLEGAGLIIALSKALKGQASTWFSQITFPGITWTDFKSLFNARYDCRDTAAAFLINLNNNRPKEGESLSSYAATMYTSLMSRWKDMSTEEIVVSSILAHLAQFEPRVQHLSFTTEVSSRAKLQQELSAVSFLKRKPNERDGPDAKRFKPSTVSGVVKCFSCGKTGHKAVHCRSKPLPSTSRDPRPQPPLTKPGVVCFNCRGIGHYAKSCTQPINKGTNGPVQTSTEKRVDVCDVTGPRGSLSHSGEEFSFYYDSGAECSLIKETVSNKFKGKRLQLPTIK